ncbi:MAG TPA: PhzF family phenazine biosynthesis protein [Croceibacterium sp.]|nr:PhzF family phenazine biosynthesis protein [Croceibacterium sp.]
MSPAAVPYWHIDAFASRPFGGNQAAVLMLGEWLPDTVLQAIARETMFAATAFAVADASGAADCELRWFTPVREIRLCGHATLAAGHVLLGGNSADRATFRTRQAGILEVRRTDRGLELALPTIRTESGEWTEAAQLLGRSPQEVRRSRERYAVFVFESEHEVRALAPDLRGLAAFGDHQFICTAPGTATDVVSRVFVPGAGIDEDSVTGSAHAVLAPIWAARLGRNRFTAHQASARGGDLTCRLDGERAWLGGCCTTVVEGSFYLSG